MAQGVLEGLHPDWVGNKRGFAGGDMEKARAMISERVRAGWSAPDSAQVDLTPDGFVFRGQPITPPHYWETLIADLSPEQVRVAKSLAPEPVSGAARARR
jgi:hypothetical protein